jgi:hypothetical protein
MFASRRAAKSVRAPGATGPGLTLQTIATTYHVPLWTLTQLNKASETAALTEGQRGTFAGTLWAKRLGS